MSLLETLRSPRYLIDPDGKKSAVVIDLESSAAILHERAPDTIALTFTHTPDADPLPTLERVPADIRGTTGREDTQALLDAVRET